MTGRALIVWLGLCVLAILNGTFRQYLLVPHLGTYAGHVLSSVSLSLLILWVAWLTIRWMGPSTGAEAWRVGLTWLAATMAFEFLAGHYLFRNPWSKLLADYDVLRGRVWIVVLAATAVAPRWAAGARGLLRGGG